MKLINKLNSAQRDMIYKKYIEMEEWHVWHTARRTNNGKLIVTDTSRTLIEAYQKVNGYANGGIVMLFRSYPMIYIDKEGNEDFQIAEGLKDEFPMINWENIEHPIDLNKESISGNPFYIKEDGINYVKYVFDFTIYDMKETIRQALEDDEFNKVYSVAKELKEYKAKLDSIENAKGVKPYYPIARVKESNTVITDASLLPKDAVVLNFGDHVVIDESVYEVIKDKTGEHFILNFVYDVEE